MKAFNQEAGRRMRQSLVDDGTQAIHYKNVKQLQKFKDYLDELESAAPEVSPLEELMRREMHRNLQDSRSRQQDVIPVCGQPLQYNTYGFQQGTIELGHPLPLNVGLISQAFGRRDSAGNVAPFSLTRPPPLPPPRDIPMPATDNGFDRRRKCIVCGNVKRQHARLGAKNLFGEGLCTLEWCDPCGHSKTEHEREARRRGLAISATSKLMGPQCIFKNR
jgi:hypothetical protein